MKFIQALFLTLLSLTLSSAAPWGDYFIDEDGDRCQYIDQDKSWGWQCQKNFPDLFDDLKTKDRFVNEDGIQCQLAIAIREEGWPNWGRMCEDEFPEYFKDERKFGYYFLNDDGHLCRHVLYEEGHFLHYKGWVMECEADPGPLDGVELHDHFFDEDGNRCEFVSWGGWYCEIKSEERLGDDL